MIRLTMTRLLAVSGLIWALLIFPGCNLLSLGGPNDETRERLARQEYPADARYGPDLDVLVSRDGKLIRIANRTPQRYRDMQLWLNQQYVAEVREIAIGAGNRFELARFVNRYEESFPRGGFLRPEEGFPVVLAELYDPDTQIRHRLVVQPPIEKDIKEIALSQIRPD